MTLSKPLLISGATFLVALAGAQDQLTPPIQPKVAPLVTPPVITLPVPPGPLAVPQTPITAEDAGRIALLHQPQIKIAQASILAAHGNVLVAAQALIPNVGITFGYNKLVTAADFGGSPPTTLQGNGTVTGNGTNSGTGWSAQFTLTQLLFDFGKTIDQVRQAELSQKAAEFALTASQSDSVYQVKQDFYAYAQAQGQVTVAEENLKDRQDNLALAQARLNSGLGAPGDVVTAQTNLDSSELTLITNRNSNEIAEVKLALDMGVDPRTPITTGPSKERPIPNQDVNVLANQALKTRPEVKQQEALIRSAGYQVSAAQKGLLPTINIVGTAEEDPFITPTPRTSEVTLELLWNPLDILGTRGQTEIARASLLTSKQNLIQASQTVISDVSQAFLNLKYAEESLTTAQTEITNAQEGLRIAEGQYKAGVATFVTVEDAEANLAQARSDVVNAEEANELALSQMEHALGQSL
jgi:outer membrane protein